LEESWNNFELVILLVAEEVCGNCKMKEDEAEPMVDR
jgi:hypothetical protein